MKVLDCTLRDGGYYNFWDFSEAIAEVYFKSMEQLPVEVLEIGYRSRQQKEYLGKYFYCPLPVIEKVKKWAPSRKLAIMLNEKDCAPDDLDYLLEPCKGNVSMIRLAIAPARFEQSLKTIEAIKKRGFEVGVNIMYMSTLTADAPIFNNIHALNDLVDVFSLVDSYGGIYPDQVKKIVCRCKEVIKVPMGFHGHNNIELVFANSLAAVEAGCEYVDATVTGMGRGAGNLKTELLLTHLGTNCGWDVDFNVLSNVVGEFEKLREIYRWGTNLPYMVSGANSLPQKDVMDWVTKRYYSINSIIRALHNQKNKEEDNLKLPVFTIRQKHNRVLIVGGGPSVVEYSEAINTFLDKNRDICLIHASSKHSNLFRNCCNPQFYCLVGNEADRMESVFTNLENLNGVCVLPPFPRKMGTYIPSAMLNKSFELKAVTFSDHYTDSHTAVALQTALDLGAREVFVAGYDGYPGQLISGKEQDLIRENNYLFNKAANHFERISFVTLSQYDVHNYTSIYYLIS